MKPGSFCGRGGFLLFLVLMFVAPSTVVAQESGGLQDLLRRAFGGGGVKEQKETLREKTVTAPLKIDDEEKLAPPKIKIFIDPGHGGKETGAKSADLFMEKEIALRLAGTITGWCEKNKRIEVITSRKDDTDSALIDRINQANGSGAVIYVSLHTGGSGQPQNFPGLIYLAKGEETETDPWRKSQYPRQTEAATLAGLLQKNIQSSIGREVRIVATDRLFLGAFTMPALIIEPINLADPSDLMKMGDEKYIAALGKNIARTLISYINAHYPITERGGD